MGERCNPIYYRKFQFRGDLGMKIHFRYFSMFKYYIILKWQAACRYYEQIKMNITYYKIASFKKLNL